MSDFRKRPIKLEVLPHTGRKDGDDAGYRFVAVKENEEPLVILNEMVKCVPVYAIGAVTGLCPYYGNGLGASATVLARRSVPQTLARANDILRAYEREIVVVDAWRSAKVQARLWQDVRRRILAREGRNEADKLSMKDEVRIGLLADDIGSYAPIIKDAAFNVAVSAIQTMPEADEAAKANGLTAEQATELYVTFLGNRGQINVDFDERGTTAHGAGGGLDIYLRNTTTGKFTCLGVPFDFAGPESTMDFFENPANLPAYFKKIPQDDGLLQYITETVVNGTDKTELFNAIRDERRLLFHTMMEVGATFYIGEPWHINFGSLDDGPYPGAGGGCHSLLKNVRGDDGEYVAVWGNGEAHRMAREILGSV